MTEEKHHSSSHRKHHRHKDESDIFRERQLRAVKNRKLYSRLLFTAGCVVALVIVLAVMWLYTNE